MSNAVTSINVKQSLATKFAERFNVDAGEVKNILKATAFKIKEGTVTDEQMSSLMIIANEYNLNPFTKEIYAYPDKGGIVPVVGVDGWTRIMNEHAQFDGVEFKFSEETVKHKGKDCNVWIECIITRKDRSKPIVVREYFDEVVRTPNFPTPWDSHPKRMHRHKTLIQAARVAFGFSGIYDEDEAERILEKDVTPVQEAPKEPVYYTDAEFEEKTVSFKSAYLKGVKKGSSVDDFYAWVETKGKKLTDNQKAEIALWKEPEVIQGEATVIDDPFVAEMNAAESAQ